jgi:signal transduction histidine kinase
MAFNVITLDTPDATEAPFRDQLNEALMRELLHRTKSAGVALLGAVVLLWLILGDQTGTVVFVQFLAVSILILARMVGAIWLERRGRFDTMRAFGWFAAVNFLIGGGLGAIILSAYPHLPPLGVAMCSVCIVGINSAAMVSLAGSPLVYLLYVVSNMAALSFVSFAHPLQGLERPFQVMQFIYGAALIVMMRSVHRSLRNNIVLRLRLGRSLEELRDTQARLVDASREAGRADVAATVLHSVGNVLNSVNVSATLVTEALGKSRLQTLPRVLALVEDHRNDLPAFFRDDPRGQKLPEYCARLAEAVERDHGVATSELAALTQNLDLIKAVVAAQQERIKPASVVETCDVHDVLDEALSVHAAASGPQAIEVVRRFHDLPPARLDRYKILQILIALLANARDAVLAGDLGERRIIVSARRGDAGDLEIAIDDNGCGIDPKDLDQVFGLGYTTKPGRHGVALHVSACAARELKGALTARSPGLGHGASFLLTLPLG